MSQRRERPGLPETPQRRAVNSPRRVRISKAPEVRRQEMIETALELFSEKGYENTTIQDIAGRMQVSPGLCYRYFKSKTEIFAATSEYYAKRAVEQIQIPSDGDVPALEKLSLFLEQIVEYVMIHKEFEADYPRQSSEYEIRASRLDYTANELSYMLEAIVSQGVSEGVFRCDDVRQVTRFLIFGLIHVFHEDIPADNMEAYIIRFHGFVKNIIADVLKIEEWK